MDLPANLPALVVPGDKIVDDAIFMRGHGVIHDGSALLATVAGRVVRVNKLISVAPFHRRYIAEIGDVVIGRVIDIGPRYWRVSIESLQDAIMLLVSVSQADRKDQRQPPTLRTTEPHEDIMRAYLKEGDLFSAEVHSFFHDGAAFLHIRNEKHGKLSNGVLTRVPPALIRRLKSYSFSVTPKVSVLLGRNGLIWINTPEHPDASAFADISRIFRAISLLSSHSIDIDQHSIDRALATDC